MLRRRIVAFGARGAGHEYLCYVARRAYIYRASGVKLILRGHGKGRRVLSAEHSMRITVGHGGPARGQRKLSRPPATAPAARRQRRRRSAQPEHRQARTSRALRLCGAQACLARHLDDSDRPGRPRPHQAPVESAAAPAGFSSATLRTPLRRPAPARPARWCAAETKVSPALP